MLLPDILLFYFILFYFFPNGGHLSHEPWPTAKARSGDHFIMGVPDRQITVISMKGRTVHPYLNLDSNPVPSVQQPPPVTTTPVGRLIM